MQRRSRSVLRVVGVTLGLVATVVGVKWTGVGAIRHALSRVGGNIAWMFAAYAAGTVVGAIPWRQLLPRPSRPTWNATVTSRFAASGLNALLPFFGLGESVRLLWLPRSERTPGLAALVVDRLLFLAAGMPLLVIAALAATRIPVLPHGYRVGVLISAAIIGIAVAAVAVGAARGRLVGRLRWAMLLFGVPPRVGKSEANGDGGSRGVDGEPVDRALNALLRGSPAPLASGFALHLCARFLLAAEIYAGLRILGARVGPLETLVFVAIPIALSVIGTFVPGQIGLQEGASALIAAALGIGPATGFALVFLQRLRQLVFVPLAGLLIALVPSGPSSTSDPQGSS